MVMNLWHRIKLVFYILASREGGIEMMAMFFAQRIILGKLTWAELKSRLRTSPLVKEVETIIIESGLEFLLEEE